jgi:hypothetical protein
MNLVPSRFARHSPRPSVCSPRSFKASAVALVGRSTAHSFPSLPNTRSACAHTLSPVDSSCIRSLVATRCNNLLFRRRAANRETIRAILCDRPAYRSVRDTRQTHFGRIPGERDIEIYCATTSRNCRSYLVSPPLHGARTRSFYLNQHSTPTKHNVREGAGSC